MSNTPENACIKKRAFGFKPKALLVLCSRTTVAIAVFGRRASVGCPNVWADLGIKFLYGKIHRSEQRARIGVGKIVFAASRGDTSVACGNDQLCGPFNADQRKNTQGKIANLVSAARFAKGSAVMIRNVIGDPGYRANAGSEIGAALKRQNVQAKSDRFGCFDHSAGLVGAGVNGQCNVAAEGIGGKIRLKNRNTAFATVQQHALIKNNDNP